MLYLLITHSRWVRFRYKPVSHSDIYWKIPGCIFHCKEFAAVCCFRGGCTILYLYICLTLFSKSIFPPARAVPVVFIYSVWLAPLEVLILPLTAARCPVCAWQSLCVTVMLSGRLTLTRWLAVCLPQMPWLVRPALPSLPMGNLVFSICRKKKAPLWCRAPDRSSCDEWGLGAQTSEVTKTRNGSLDLRLGLWDQPENTWKWSACLCMCVDVLKLCSCCHLQHERDGVLEYVW